jgi:predicted transcriptional regulator of viral defense system
MSRPNYIDEIKRMIMRADNGAVFVSTDFTDITDKKTVNSTLFRMEEEGTIKRVLRGVYYKPEYNAFLGEYVAPIPDKVAHGLARNFGWTIVPCGDTALNLLGLSPQVPAVWLYVSDGTYKEYSYGNTTIRFKKTTNKEISKLSYKTALVVQAMKALGKERIDDVVISRLSKTLTQQEKKAMLTEAKAATSWIYEYIKEICRG